MGRASSILIHSWSSGLAYSWVTWGNGFVLEESSCLALCHGAASGMQAVPSRRPAPVLELSAPTPEP